MRPFILVVLACATHGLGIPAVSVRSANHGRVARAYGHDDKRDFPSLLGPIGGAASADAPGDENGESAPADGRPSAAATRGDDGSLSSFNIFPGLIPTNSAMSLKTKGLVPSTASTPASATATAESRLASTTQAQAAPASTLNTSSASATATSTAKGNHPFGGGSALTSDSSWKIIGVAVICFTAVVAILVAAVFFDTWWHFVRDLFWRRRRQDGLEEMLPDWEKASWEVRLGDDRHRYPSFGSLPNSPVSRGDPLQRQRSLRVQEWQKEEKVMAGATAVGAGLGLTPAERLAQYPAIPPIAYVSPDPRPSPGNIDPSKYTDKPPKLGATTNVQAHKDPFRDPAVSPRVDAYGGIDGN